MSQIKLSTVLSLSLPRIPNIQTLNSLLLTSHQIRSTILDNLTPHALFMITRRSRVYSDDKASESWYLLSLIAGAYAPWLALSSINRRAFKDACPALPDSLLDIAADHPVLVNRSSFSLEVLQKTVSRKEIVVGLSDLVDRCVGAQWHAIPDFWDGGAEDAATLEAEVDGAIWQMLVYGELFGSGLGGWLDSLLGPLGDGNSGLTSSASDRLNEQNENISLARMSDFNTFNIYPYAPFVGLALRCEYVKYAMIDRRVPLEWHDRGSRPWGIATDWKYPASLLSDDGERSGFEEGGCAEATNQSTAELDLDDAFISLWEDDSGVQWDRPHETDTNARRPMIYKPINHAIRRVKLDGQYSMSSRMDMESEQCTVLLFLLKHSSLWAKVTQPIRHRAIDLAQEPQILRRDESSSPHIAPSTVLTPLEIGYRDETSLIYASEEEGFGKTVKSAVWPEKASWKQRIWEDALWTAGWGGLEVIADAWEHSEENYRAIARRQVRGTAPASRVKKSCIRKSTAGQVREEDHCGTATSLKAARSANEHSRADIDDRVPNDHPVMNQLISTYSQLQLLRDCPRGIEFRSVLRPEDKRFGSEGPAMVSDMGLMIWEPSWR